MLSITFWHNGIEKQNECFLSEDSALVILYSKFHDEAINNSEVMKTGKSSLEIH